MTNLVTWLDLVITSIGIIFIGGLIYYLYIKKQEKEIQKMKKIEQEKIPSDIEFKSIPGLTAEVIEKLNKSRPKTIGEAIKISGVTPAALLNIHIFIQIQAKKDKKSCN